MGIHDSYHQNVILSCIDDLVTYTFRGNRIAECQSMADSECKYGDHKMVKYCIPQMEKCSTCMKYKRGSLSEGLLCKGKFIIIPALCENNIRLCITYYTRPDWK